MNIKPSLSNFSHWAQGFIKLALNQMENNYTYGFGFSLQHEKQ